MRFIVVFAVILQLQRFWVFADPKTGYKEPQKDTESYKVQPDQAWIAAETRRLQRGFLPSSSSARDYAAIYQQRIMPAIEGRYRPQPYSQPAGSYDYTQTRDETRHTCPQRRAEIKSQRYTQAVYLPEDAKYVTKGYKQFSASPSSYSRAETQTHYNSQQTPEINSEGYQVVNEDAGLHTVVVSSSDQYSQPQVVTIRGNGQAYTSNLSQYRSQGAAVAYEYPEASRGSMQQVQSGSEMRMSYSPQDKQPEIQYRSRHSQHSSTQKSKPHVVSNSDSSHRIEVLSNRQAMNVANQ